MATKARAVEENDNTTVILDRTAIAAALVSVFSFVLGAYLHEMHQRDERLIAAGFHADLTPYFSGLSVTSMLIYAGVFAVFAAVAAGLSYLYKRY